MRAVPSPRAAVFVLGCVLVAGCGLSTYGTAPPGDDSALDASAAGDAAPLPEASDGIDAATKDAAAIDAAVADVGPSCDPDVCPGERCDAGKCAFYADCHGMHTADPGRKTGMHTFKGAAGNYAAWCDMDKAGGGWTLVARSVLFGNSSSFGWGSATGTAADMASPYSLDVVTNGVAFTEALVGDRGLGTNVWGNNVYQIGLPPNFPASQASSAAATTQVSVVASYICQTGPQMLGNVGFTSHTQDFFLRDNATDGFYGLGPDGFHLAYFASCAAGFLDGNQGMIMVR